MDNLEPKKNKKHGLTEIVIGLLFFAPPLFNLVRGFMDPESKLFIFGYLSIKIIGLIFLVIGLAKMLKNKNTVKKDEIISKDRKIKRVLKWVIIAIIFFAFFAYIYFTGGCGKRETSIFCMFTLALYLIPLVLIGVFILFIKLIRHFTKNK